MGSRRSPTLYKLVFDDTTDAPGFEITLKSLTIKQRRELNLRARADETEMDVVARTCELLAGQMVSWNREDEDGRPLPMTVESLMDEEPGLIIDISVKWQQAIAGVSGPLESDSPSGEISPVESVLTDIPSESLAS
ncbi:hypothetical protein V2S66_31405 [Streptomyces sp. V4-01]|uniref:Uncharacterized protein n=1 Tax=Actinacidiphila polyblastidii TaxID=3110430 RepID=A0ABU7PKV8_9ACTN|nr:hypothetical protein [Streptomyces sp. V4-01]